MFAKRPEDSHDVYSNEEIDDLANEFERYPESPYSLLWSVRNYRISNCKNYFCLLAVLIL